MNVEDLFENLESLDAEALIRLADATDVLNGVEQYDLILLIQELAGRLEDVLNLDVLDAKADLLHEYNPEAE